MGGLNTLQPAYSKYESTICLIQLGNAIDFGFMNVVLNLFKCVVSLRKSLLFT